MAETSVKAYAVTASNVADTAPTNVAVINDGTGNRQVVVLGAGDGTTTLVDGTSAHPLNTNLIGSGGSTIKDDTGFGDGVTSGIVAAAVRLWNGTSYDRLKGDATNGAYVNVKAISPLGTILNGKKTVTTAGTRVTLAASTACSSVTIKALLSNTSVIYVGNSTVASSNGFELLPGDAISLDVSNLNTVNLDAAFSGDGVSYIGVV